MCSIDNALLNIYFHEWVEKIKPFFCIPSSMSVNYVRTFAKCKFIISYLHKYYRMCMVLCIVLPFGFCVYFVIPSNRFFFPHSVRMNFNVFLCKFHDSLHGFIDFSFLRLWFQFIIHWLEQGNVAIATTAAAPIFID